ncbi:MAG: N-acetyltransferase [Oscillospiraceae bacterium]|nr:N-acetyltransferase [Oscillospiraceae bacterium]
MTVRLATYSDLPAIQSVYESARFYMRANGNKDQWKNDYPSNGLLSSDIFKNTLYVIEEDRVIHAVFVLAPGPDPTYLKIDGSWLTDDDYYVIHRIASDGKLRGVLSTAIQVARSKATSLRIDTHKDNKIMQDLLLKMGLAYCGIIHLENGDPRLAYQILLHETEKDS